ncbi:hypothetical protein N0V93_004904 [Gnomoniopsis smithogilvyi]|uniref:Enoyl reductase (ER) domain-containing protein n=1 Tax=Gnomoniopsis smithogilvyi TaxID=1191159 RepID=A0A9W8YVK1_9PEZI|nr:hypothetical protein N0V93_004904 [Gnomoniopsis smithogilvyi]
MKALVLDAEERTATLSPLPMPAPGPNELLIAVKAIALNPVDALYTFQPLGSTGRIVGSDFAGLVVARGPPAPAAGSPESSSSSVTAGGSPSRLRRSSTALSAVINRGERVAGFLQGACSVNERPGAFAEYVVVPADLVWRIPGHVSFEEAASVSLCGLTAAQGLFFRLGLDAPFQWEDESEEGVLRRVENSTSRDGEDAGADEFSFFVAGASTSVGMYVAQLVRHSAEVSGKRVRLIGAASPQNWDMLRAEPYGYETLVDYHDPTWPEQVRQASGGGVQFAYDSISEGSTVRDVSSTLRQGGKMAVVRSREAGAWDSEGVLAEPVYGAVWEGLGEDIQYQNFMVQTSPAKRSFATAFYKWLSDGGMLQPNPVRVMPGGLDKVVEDGFVLLGTGVSNRNHDRTEEHMRPISGEKLVYAIEVERRGSTSTGEGHIA